MRKNTKMVDAIFEKYAPIFDLKLPFVWDTTKAKNYYGWHMIKKFPKIGKVHFIGLNFKELENEKHLTEIICHELIHAWQYDNNKKLNHGHLFADWCAWFKAEFGLNTASADVDRKRVFKTYCKIMQKKGN